MLYKGGISEGGAFCEIKAVQNVTYELHVS